MANNNYKRWSNSEIEFLQFYYKTMLIKNIAIELKRSYNSVLHKANSLGLNRVNLNSRKNKLTRICTVCLNELPKTKKYFTTFVSSRDGVVFQTKCKSCEKNYIQKINSTPIKTFKGILRNILKYNNRTKNGFDIDLDFLLNLWKTQKHQCAITGIEMTTLKGKAVYYYTNVSVDKIIPENGYVKSNIQLVCSWANSAKSNLDETTFKKMISLTFNKMKSKI